MLVPDLRFTWVLVLLYLLSCFYCYTIILLLYYDVYYYIIVLLFEYYIIILLSCFSLHQKVVIVLV